MLINVSSSRWRVSICDWSVKYGLCSARRFALGKTSRGMMIEDNRVWTVIKYSGVLNGNVWQGKIEIFGRGFRRSFVFGETWRVVSKLIFLIAVAYSTSAKPIFRDRPRSFVSRR